MNDGGIEGTLGAEPLPPEILGEPPPPFPSGVLVDAIFFTFAKPAVTAAPAAAKPKAGPIIGIPANDL